MSGSKQEGGDQKGKDEQGSRPNRTAAEWTTFAVSLAILLGLAGLLTYQQLAGGARPATIVVSPRLEALRREADAHYLPVEIANRGDTTVQDVRVRLSLTSEGRQPESAELLITFLAGGETARGTVVFREDPTRANLSIDGVSYLDP
jgi:uncharacterized protein (TIGR02588 family)